MLRVRKTATCATLGFAVALVWAADVGADSIDRYDPAFVMGYMESCAERGTDQRGCACAIDQIATERGRSGTPSVDAGPPSGHVAVPVTATRYGGFVAMCTRSAVALGLIEN